MARRPMIVPQSVGAGGSGGVSPMRIVQAQADTSVDRAALTFTKGFDELVEKEAAIARVEKLADAGSAWHEALDKKRLELATDPDVSGREAKLQKFAQEEFKKHYDAMPDGTTRALFKRTANHLADTVNSSVRQQAQKDVIDNAVVTLRGVNEDLVKKAGDARTDNEREAILGQIRLNIDEAQKSNMLTPAQHKAELQATLVKADQAAGLRAIRENPHGTEKMLGNSGFLPNLDPVTRENLINKAGAEVNRRASLAYTQEARAEVAERRRLRVQGDDAMKEIIAADADTTLTRRFVEERRHLLPHADYAAGLEMAKGGAKTDARDTLITLETAVHERPLKNEINNAFAAKQITKETYRSLMQRNEEALKDDMPASPYKRGREQITEGLRPGALLSGPAADIQKQALINALREYDEMTARVGVREMRGTPSLALDGAAEIVSRHRIVNFSAIGEAIGRPKYLTAPSESISDDDLKAAGRQILTDRDNGFLSRDEANTQLKKLELWEHIVKDRDEALKKRALQPGAKPK